MFRAHPDTESQLQANCLKSGPMKLIPLSVLRLDLPHVDATFLAVVVPRSCSIPSVAKRSPTATPRGFSLNALSMRRGRPRCSAPPTAPPRNTTANGAA